MTVTSVRVYEPVHIVSKQTDTVGPKHSPPVWQASDPPFKGYTLAPSDGYQRSSASTAIVIDNGTLFTYFENCLTRLWTDIFLI